MPIDARDMLTRLVTAMDVHDLAEIDRLVDPEVVVDFRQSGERIRGITQFVEQFVRYPDFEQIVTPAAEDTTIIGREDRWAISPNYTVVPLSSPDVFTILQRTRYPDGSWWHVVVVAELREGKLFRGEAYFAPEMPAPLLEGLVGANAPAQ